MGASALLFPPFRMDLSGEQLWNDRQAIALRPKTFAVLRYLAEHPGKLASKQELLDAVWGETAVSDGVLKTCVQELRQALGDDARTPQFVETVHRRGYRFRAPVQAVECLPTVLDRSPGPRPPAPPLVGRAAELEKLRACFQRAEQGERQIVFVSGEPGIGKTALVDAFLAELIAADHQLVGQGQCIEQYGAGEPYLPIIEALGRLGRRYGSDRLRAALERHAPTWLAQLPALVAGADLEALQRAVAGATPERRLREMAELLEMLSAAQTLVLWLEDLHWSDVSTLELLSMVARRREVARLMVIASYRPADVIARSHALREVKHELVLHGACHELPLGFLTGEAVAEYLARRFGAGLATPLLLELAGAIHQRSDGNPLFMVNFTDDVVRRGALVERNGVWELEGSVEQVASTMPDTLRHMIEWQLERLDETDRRILCMGSVAGVDFCCAAVAAGMDAAVETVEDRCDALTRRAQFLVARGTRECPDGTLSGEYAFVHALFQRVTYQSMSASRRVLAHHRIAVWHEAAYGARAAEIAAQIAVHFERGRDAGRAIHYLHAAAENAFRRGAHREAVAHLTNGIELLPKLRNDGERLERELALQVMLGGALIVGRGYASPAVEAAYGRAHELSNEVSASPLPGIALVGLAAFHFNRGELSIAQELGRRALSFAARVGDHDALSEAHNVLGIVGFFRGALSVARDHLEQVIALRARESRPSFSIGHESGVAGAATLAIVLLYLGHADGAVARSREALTSAARWAHPFTIAYVQTLAAYILEGLRDGEALRAQAEALLALATDEAFPQRIAQATIMRGWAWIGQGRSEQGIDEIRRGTAAYAAVGAAASRPYYLGLLAAAHERAGQAADGLAVVNEALDLVRKMGGSYYYEAELLRVKGQLLLLSSRRGAQGEARTPEAEACFREAIEIARGQQAKILELRATMSLCRLWRARGRERVGCQALAEIYGWFTEGFDAPDLADARALLDELRA